jgi:imidazoleglycerol phosphate synthase glutamine amidotransferase subunit HisH
MPDLQQFTITALASASVNVPRAQIEALVVDSQTQATIADFTGANALIFPGVITTLSAADRLELAQLIARWLLLKKAGF